MNQGQLKMTLKKSAESSFCLCSTGKNLSLSFQDFYMKPQISNHLLQGKGPKFLLNQTHPWFERGSYDDSVPWIVLNKCKIWRNCK